MRAKALPKFVDRALDHDFRIVHKTLLCWSTKPLAENVPKVRAAFLIIESQMTIGLWVLIRRRRGHGALHLCRWKLTSLRYHGLCSHHAFTEGAGLIDLSLNAEQLAELEQRRQASREWRWRNPEQVARMKPVNKRYRAKVLESKVHGCDLWFYYFRTELDKTRHFANQYHQKAVQKAANPPQKKYKCVTCLYYTNERGNYKKHLTFKVHHRKVAAEAEFKAKIEAAEQASIAAASSGEAVEEDIEGDVPSDWELNEEEEEDTGAQGGGENVELGDIDGDGDDDGNDDDDDVIIRRRRPGRL